MRLLTLHDSTNPSREVEIDADSLATVTPFSGGSIVQVGDSAPVAVKETPEEIRGMVNGL